MDKRFHSPSAGRVAARESGRYSPTTQVVALLVSVFFAFPLTRFYLIADLKDFACPHHVESQGVAPTQAVDHSSHAGHGTTPAADPGAPPAQRDSGLRCCCRHSLDGLITTLLLDTPADAAKTPLPERAGRVSLLAELSVLESDLPTPFEPPRI